MEEGFRTESKSGDEASVFLWWSFVISSESTAEKIHISTPRYKRRKDVLKAATDKMYGRLTSKKKKFSYGMLSYRQGWVFFTILLETPPSGPHVPSTLKKRRSPKELHHIIANEQSSVAVFSVYLCAVVSKLALLAAGSIFLCLLLSISCRRRRKKEGNGGRMIVPTESPKRWTAR